MVIKMGGIKYVPLHVHTTYSVLDAYGTPEMMVEKAKELGLDAIALTEHGNTSSHVKLQKAAKKHGIKPIYGIELYMVEDIEDNQQKKYHITVLAKNKEGYQNLLTLSTLAYEEDHFYYQPTIDLKDLFSYQAGLIVLSGCQSGILSQMAINGENYETIKALANTMNANIDHFYLEIQPLDLDDSRVANETLIKISQETGIPLVATNDVHWVNKGEEKIQQFLSMVRRKKNISDGWGLMDERCRLATGGDMLEWGSPVEAINNTVKIAEMVEEFDLPKAKTVKYPDTDNAKETLLEWCREGWRNREIPREDWDEYKERLFYELDIIEQKDFLDYFLIVGDMVRWAKEQGILVGPARGSAAGSLLSYLLGITEVDPIEWDLLFERFMDVERYDPPDIDLDFQHDRRDEVKEYLKQKYGEKNVANIAGYGTFGAKSVLDDFGRCFNVPRRVIEKAKDELIENGGSKTVEEIIEERWPEYSYVAKVEGMIRNFTIHAAGVLVATNEISNYTTIGRNGVLLDKRDVAELGLLKIDVLGLKTLTAMSYTLDAIGKDWEWLYNIPLDDPETIAAFSEDNFANIFQFEGNTTKGICQQLEPKDFQTLIDINALSRPGPLGSGATEAYINGWKDDIHPVVTEETARSRGQILFQEQIMRILKKAGNLSWSDVNMVRKLITKNDPDAAKILAEIKARFLENFDDKELAEEIWSRCGESGAYGFNISHSTSYTFITYQTMYLKVHYPQEFYWGNLMVWPDKEELLREYILNGGKIYGVKYPKSGARWTIDKDGLRAGYMTLQGIGPKTAEKLLDGEVTGRAKTILEEAGAFDLEDDEPVDYLGLEEMQEKISQLDNRDKIAEIEDGQFVHIAGRIINMKIKNLREIIEGQGKNYEAEVSEPEKEKYINMIVADETGEIMVTVNRFKCADPILWEELVDNRKDDDIFEIKGQHDVKYDKVYAARITKLGKKGGEEWES